MIDEEFPRGLNAAVRLATSALATQGVATLCTVLSDIPLVTGEDIDAVFNELAEEDRGVVLVPSRDLSGTNISLARRPTRFRPVRRPEPRPPSRGMFSARAAEPVVRQRGPALDL